MGLGVKDYGTKCNGLWDFMQRIVGLYHVNQGEGGSYHFISIGQHSSYRIDIASIEPETEGLCSLQPTAVPRTLIVQQRLTIPLLIGYRQHLLVQRDFLSWLKGSAAGQRGSGHWIMGKQW